MRRVHRLALPILAKDVVMIGEGNFSLAFLKLSMSSQEEEDILIAPMEKKE
ncbi:hypothetical protein ACSBR2_004922 [Camellia fascicularis]